MEVNSVTHTTRVFKMKRLIFFCASLSILFVDSTQSLEISDADLEAAFEDLKCVYGTSTAGLCWPKTDCDAREIGNMAQCSRGDLTGAMCCPLRDREGAGQDVADRVISSSKGKTNVASFVRNHKPQSNTWIMNRLSSQKSVTRKGPTIWRPPPARLVPKETCATKSVFPLIIGGIPVPVYLYPWMAALLHTSNQEVFCGGSVISPNYVLTAAHCVHGLKKEDIVIRLYDTILTQSEDDVERQPFNVLVDRIIVHESYDPAPVYNDIALLKLKQTISDPDVKPVCLATEEFMRVEFQDPKEKCEVMGYGAPSMHEDAANRLLKAPVSIATTEECEATYGGSSRLPRGVISSIMCAGDVVEQRDACRGDSGGPLVFASKGIWYIVGVVSAGRECGKFYGLYTRVPSYYDWILRNTRS